MTISLCMIVKNEEKVLARCLDSVKDIFDEIVIVDTGSYDKTKDIAKKYTRNVYDFKWVEDFSKARNYAFSKATKEYIMWLDADDIVLPKDKEGIKELISKLDGTEDIICLKYNTGFDSDGNVIFTYYRERIIKNNGTHKWVGRIHEVIPQIGTVVNSDIAITHKKGKSADLKRNLRIFGKMLEEGEHLSARERFYYARELYYVADYSKAIDQFEIFLKDETGWLENKISATIDLYNCYLAVSDEDNAIKALTKSFTYDLPRAEVCCELGSFLYSKRMYEPAKYWYNLALAQKPNISNGGFYFLDCYDFIPYIQLSVCSYMLKNIDEAIKYNEMAGKIKPNSQIYLDNKLFFEKI